MLYILKIYAAAGREHAFMFMNKDAELHELIRTELFLPYVFGEFHPADLSELSGGLLFAILEANRVDIRPLCCPHSMASCRSLSNC